MAFVVVSVACGVSADNDVGPITSQVDVQHPDVARIGIDSAGDSVRFSMRRKAGLLSGERRGERSPGGYSAERLPNRSKRYFVWATLH